MKTPNLYTAPHAEQQTAIDIQVKQFPDTFGLRAFSGVFKIDRRACYVNDTGQIMLYTAIIQPDGTAQSFAKATPAELHAEMVVLSPPTVRQIYTVHVGGAARYHGINPADAIETIIAWQDNPQGQKLSVQRNPQPVECCTGTSFHTSDCTVVRP